MSIDEDEGVGATLTEGHRALSLFTNRTDAIVQFCRHLHADPTPERILFFHGDGGNGKTLLVRTLRSRFCRHLADWDCMAVRNEELADPALAGATTVPSAYIDFRSQSQEPFDALIALRQALAERSLHFHVFDFACVWYLKKSGRLDPGRLSTLLPSEGINVISAIADAVSNTSVGSVCASLLAVFGEHIDDWVTVAARRLRVKRSILDEILKWDVELDLPRELPRIFAEDLNASMREKDAPPRVVLFFDTCEAFWGHESTTAPSTFDRDQWLRRLLRALDLKCGIVVACAGRHVPNWDGVPRPIAAARIEPVLVGNLANKDASIYLEKAEITDPDTQRWICEVAGTGRQSVHPLLLGLCADVVLALRGKNLPESVANLSDGFQRSHAAESLLGCLLRYVDRSTQDALTALSACRNFDRSLFRDLAAELGLEESDATFRRVTGFSFVLPTDGRPGFFRIHDMVKRALRGASGDLHRSAHVALEKRYKAGPGEADRAEGLYHANQVDWKRGLQEWLVAMEASVNHANYALTRSLRAVRADLEIVGDGWLGSAGRCEARHLAALAEHREAHCGYQEALGHLLSAERKDPADERVKKELIKLLVWMGDLAFERSHNQKSIGAYKAVVKRCEEFRSRGGWDGEIDELKVEALLGIGDVEDERGRLGEAQMGYEAALKSADEAVATWAAEANNEEPRNRLIADLQNDRGYALAGLGEIGAKSGHHERALSAFGLAVAAYDAAIQAVPGFEAALNNKAFNLVAAARSETALGHNERSIERCRTAIALYDTALASAPEDVVVLANRARAAMYMAQGEAATGLTDVARMSLADAVKWSAEALRLAPHDVWALSSMAFAEQGIGQLDLDGGRVKQALSHFEAAIAGFAEALKEAAGDVDAKTGYCGAQVRAGDALVALGNVEKASERYEVAVETATGLVNLANPGVDARLWRAEALFKQGRVQCAREPGSATGLWRAARAEVARALDDWPDCPRARLIAADLDVRAVSG